MENRSYFVIVNKSTKEEYLPNEVKFYPDCVSVYDPSAYSGEGGWKNFKIDDIDIEKREHSVDSILVAEEIEKGLMENLQKKDEFEEKLKKSKEVNNELKNKYPLIFKEGVTKMIYFRSKVSKEGEQHISNLKKLIGQFTKETGINGIPKQITNDLYLMFVKYEKQENNPYLTYDLFKACIYSNIFDEIKKEKMKEME